MEYRFASHRREFKYPFDHVFCVTPGTNNLTLPSLFSIISYIILITVLYNIVIYHIIIL